MVAALKFEIQKTVGTPVIPGIMVLCVLFAGLISFGTGSGMMSQVEYGVPSRTPEEFEDLVRYYLYSSTGRSAYFGTFLVGVLVATADQSNGLLAKTLIFFKSRALVTMAKIGTVVVISVVTAIIAVAMSFAIAYALMSSEPSFTSESIAAAQWAIGARTVVTFAVWGLIGFGLGLIVRNQVAAVVIVLLFTLFLEPMLTSFSNENTAFATFGKFLPGSANWAIVWPVDATGSDSAMGGLGGEALQVGPAMGVLAAYAIVLVVIGYVIGVRRRALAV